MIWVSERKSIPPDEYKTDLQKAVYEALCKLKIPFSRVDCEEAITMEDCLAIDEKFGQMTVKTLFLCNRQQTEFYLFITSGDKPFKTKLFSQAMEISRVSFAPKELLLPRLGTVLGATTVLSILYPSFADVTVVFDSDVLQNDNFVCCDSTTTGYMMLKTSDLTEKLFPFAKRKFKIITLDEE